MRGGLRRFEGGILGMYMHKLLGRVVRVSSQIGLGFVFSFSKSTSTFPRVRLEDLVVW
jgi:hypothetical protein